LRLSGDVLTDRVPRLCCAYVPKLMQGRIEELADKCTEGKLTEEERDEYDMMH
jgi:hypothetical protein